VGVWGSNAPPLLYLVPCIAFVLMLLAAMRRDRPASRPEERRHIGRVVGLASGLEGLAILAAFVFLPAMQSVEFSVSVQAIIVGLHFVLLARWLPAPAYYVTAAVFVGLGATGFAIGDAGLRIPYVCWGAACALWLSYAVTAVAADDRPCRSAVNCAEN